MVLGASVPVERKLLSRRRITPEGCWVFTGHKNYSGYGQVRYRGKLWRVHVLAYTVFVGRPKHNVCHKPECTDKACFNPEHLYDGTQKQNYDDSISAGTHYNAR